MPRVAMTRDSADERLQVPEHEQVDERAQHAREDQGDHRPERQRQIVLAGALVKGEGARHHDGALREVEQTRAAVDQHETLGEHGVDAARPDAQQHEPEDLHVGVPSLSE